MKIPRRWLLVLLLLFAVTGAQARPRVYAVNNGPQPKPKPVAYWTVDAVDQETKIITLTKSDGQDSQKYKVTAATKITISGQPDKLANVQPGMKVENLSLSAGTLSVLAVVQATKPAADSKKDATGSK